MVLLALLFAGFILWLSSPLIAEFFEYIKTTVLSQIGEWICNLLRLELGFPENVRPFVVSEYLARIEKASLSILEERKPTDKTIVMWWGMDGLRLNEDGTTEQVSRKKLTKTAPYQLCQSTQPQTRFCAISAEAFSGMCNAVWLTTTMADQTQCTRAQIDMLMAQSTALQM